jgi:hypothetical protein
LPKSSWSFLVPTFFSVVGSFPANKTIMPYPTDIVKFRRECVATGEKMNTREGEATSAQKENLEAFRFQVSLARF